MAAEGDAYSRRKKNSRQYVNDELTVIDLGQILPVKYRLNIGPFVHIRS